ncbi:MAG: HAMP domain-containing histidine kinase [Chitinophagaceae bacterium]|nr:HAMP domain-containing histidine kinase [Chitinophagaceae bacterium]
MENQLTRTSQKIGLLFTHSSMGLAEIDKTGHIVNLNPKGTYLLRPILISLSIQENNFLQVLNCIAPALNNRITETAEDAGVIASNESYAFNISFCGETIERHFEFTVIKMCEDCILIEFCDVTPKHQNQEAIHQLANDKAVIQGKCEIATNILHDIGNALVGFGSYINRIKRSVDQGQSANMQKLSDFLATQRDSITAAFGEVKSNALVNMLSSLTDTQKINEEEIRKAITEQINIITHIQEIMTIQRQFAKGQESPEKLPLNIRSIINDCLSMLLATIQKRGIKVIISTPEKLPILQGDRTRLMQVILNIIKNSIESIDILAEEKTITITATINPGRFELNISDNGRGFDAAIGSKLFERGFTTKVSGSGIGLSSCRTIIESHGGTIAISSEGFEKGALTTIQFKI